MSHITQEHVRELAERSGFLFQDVGYAPTFHTMPLEYSEKCFQRLCNAAIQHYIDSAALAQPEPSCKDTGVCVQSGLYVSAKGSQPEPVEPVTDTEVCAALVTKSNAYKGTPESAWSAESKMFMRLVLENFLKSRAAAKGGAL